MSSKAEAKNQGRADTMRGAKDLPASKGLPAVFGVKFLADYLDVNPKTVYENIHQIPHFRIGRLLRFRRAEILGWMGGSGS